MVEKITVNLTYMYMIGMIVKYENKSYRKIYCQHDFPDNDLTKDTLSAFEFTFFEAIPVYEKQYRRHNPRSPRSDTEMGP